MTKSELIEALAAKQAHLSTTDVELAVKLVLEIMSDALAEGKHIEIRGFGRFSIHYHPAHPARNPKTGEAVTIAGRYGLRFRAGLELRQRVNASAGRLPIKE